MPQIIAQLTLAALLAIMWITAIKDCFVKLDGEALPKAVVFAVIFSLFIGLVASAGAFDRLPDLWTALQLLRAQP